MDDKKFLVKEGKKGGKAQRTDPCKGPCDACEECEEACGAAEMCLDAAAELEEAMDDKKFLVKEGPKKGKAQRTNDPCKGPCDACEDCDEGDDDCMAEHCMNCA